MNRLGFCALGLFTAALVAAARIAPEPPAQTSDVRENAYRANNVGVAQLEQYSYDAAAASFQTALGIDGNLHIARLNLAIAQLYASKGEDALATAASAAEQLPDLPQPHYIVGLAARAIGRADDAMRAFERVLKIDPTDAGSRINLGQLQLQERKYPEATTLFRAALEAEPFNVTAAYGLALALTRSGATDEGREAMKRFETLRDSGYAVTYSQTYLEQGRYGEAIASTGAEPALVDAATPPVTFADATADALPAAIAQSPGAASTTLVPRGSVALFDVDGDGDLDVVATSRASGGARLLLNASGRFSDASGRLGALNSAVELPAAAVLAGDVDNDRKADLFVPRFESARLLRQRPDGRFDDIAQAAGVSGSSAPTVSAAFVDVDHDGDLDLFSTGHGFQAAAPERATNQLLRNNGNGTFTDITAAAGVGGRAQGIAVAPTDFDNRRDVDLLVLDAAAGPQLFKNMRNGTFRDVAADVGLPGAGAYTALAAGDVNKDGYPDFAFGRADSPGLLALSDGRGAFKTDAVSEIIPGPSAMHFVDYDNDGLLDLLAASRTGVRLLRNIGGRWSDVTASARLDAAAAAAKGEVQAMAFGDVDRDGDRDALVLTSTGQLRFWRNEGGSTRRALRVQLTGRVSNRFGIGAKVEIRAGSLRDRLETSAAVPAIAPGDLLFGLGSRASADVLRVIWPSGILQAETADASGVTAVTELDRKPSSCPYLFTWNGSKFEFVTDFMGGGEIGYWMGPGLWNTPDPDELVRIPPGALTARDGRYELRVTNELEEALFVDALQLVAIDHPSDVEVFPNEGLGAPRPAVDGPTTARGARPPLRATDDHGHDVLGRLEALDRRYVDDFGLEPIRGYAAHHELQLDLGDAAARAVLLATGWTDYAFSSDNVAAHHKGLSLKPPSLEARSPSGRWRAVIENIGIPVGRPQTVVVDLRGKLRPDEREIRILTNMRIYWDQVLVDASGGGAPTRVTRIDPVRADLRWRGFSAETSADGRQPFGYDYSRVSPQSPWKVMTGRYTREGDVRELLRKADDMFVIARPGDEIALSFAADALPPLEPGRRRTFLLHSDGFSKEMDIGSATPYTVEPLPFHAMRRYPYGSDEHYLRSDAHRAYQERYNTRVVGRSVPPLETSREP
jgi:tetratricopeptide (TPR) repeat protein